MVWVRPSGSWRGKGCWEGRQGLPWGTREKTQLLTIYWPLIWHRSVSSFPRPWDWFTWAWAAQHTELQSRLQGKASPRIKGWD